MSANFHQYMGMSYEMASREGLKLIQEAASSGRWFSLPEKLTCLREAMDRERIRREEEDTKKYGKTANEIFNTIVSLIAPLKVSHDTQMTLAMPKGKFSMLGVQNSFGITVFSMLITSHPNLNFETSTDDQIRVRPDHWVPQSCRTLNDV